MLEIKLNSHNKLIGGLNYTFLERGPGVKSSLIRPYGEWNVNLLPVEFQLGISYNYFSSNETSSIDPRFLLRYRLDNKQSMFFSFARQSKIQDWEIYYSNITIPGPTNRNLDFTKSYQFILSYQNQINSNVLFKAETYIQFLTDVPTAVNSKNSFSILNYFNEQINFSVDNNGTGKNYGIELTTQQYFHNNTFWLANVSLYESKYKGSDGIERDTRFNGNYIVNATYGKEFPYSKKGKDYILGVNLRLNYSGGLRETPIDEIASATEGTTVYDETNAYSLKQKDIFKTDLRVYWKRNKKKFNSTLALDIQNVTNRKNSSFRYYDTYLNDVVQNYQLGLIPILSYRIEF